ncbi:hypothetical protein Fmac_001880 [Flemingia macrophylla]|uniref:Uncharacterized protein n=1 Tax=Flemingia macrophylla TaxID=520843 RepID=A0ABD1NIC5_9FABA
MSVTAGVKRYWPGKVPEWADDEIEDAAPSDIRSSREAALEKVFPRHEQDVVIVRKDDRRLRRLAESRIDNREEDVYLFQVTPEVVLQDSLGCVVRGIALAGS